MGRFRIDVIDGDNRYSLIHRTGQAARMAFHSYCRIVSGSPLTVITEDEWNAIAEKCHPKEVGENSDWGDGDLYTVKAVDTPEKENSPLTPEG